MRGLGEEIRENNSCAEMGDGDNRGPLLGDKGGSRSLFRPPPQFFLPKTATRHDGVAELLLFLDPDP